MNNGKIGIFLLLCVGMSLTAKHFGDMDLNQIESLSYDKLSSANQKELIKLAIFSGTLNNIVPGTLAHSHAARSVLENKFGPQDWIKLDFMLSQKGIDAVKNALSEGTTKPQEMPMPERRPIKIEKEVEPIEQTPPPLPPRPTVTSENRPTPPPLPPTPQTRPIEQRPGSKLPFSPADLEQQKGLLKTSEKTQPPKQQQSSFHETLADRFKGANSFQEEPEEDEGDWD